MHTRRESKMSAQGNACTELIADAESLSNIIHQQCKIQNEFYVATHRKSCRIQSTMKFLRDSYGNEQQCEDGVSRPNSPSTLQTTTLQFLLRISLPSALTEKKQGGNKPCLFLINPSSHSISNGTTQIRDSLLSVISWQKWLLPCPSHLCCFKFLFIHSSGIQAPPHAQVLSNQMLSIRLESTLLQGQIYLLILSVEGQWCGYLASHICCPPSRAVGCYCSWITNSSEGTAPGLSLLQPTHGQCSAIAPLLFG